MTWLTAMENRQKVYAILGAIGTLALFYGIADEQEVALWLGLATTIFGNGMATAFSGKAYGKHAKADG